MRGVAEPSGRSMICGIFISRQQIPLRQHTALGNVRCGLRSAELVDFPCKSNVTRRSWAKSARALKQKSRSFKCFAAVTHRTAVGELETPSGQARRLRRTKKGTPAFDAPSSRSG